MSTISSRVATLNTHAGVSIPGTLRDLARMTVRRPHFVGFQEVGGIARALAMRVWLAAHGYGFTQRHGRNRNSVPIAHRRRTHRRIAAGSWHLSDATKVGAAGAGPAVLREKWATWAVYRRRRRHTIEAVICCHLAPSLQVPKQPGADMSREQLWRQQVHELGQLVDWLREHYGDDLALHVVGDLNTERLSRLHELISRGLDPGPHKPTMHGAAIDRVLSTAEPAGAVVIGHLNTDHAGLIRSVRWDAA